MPLHLWEVCWPREQPSLGKRHPWESLHRAMAEAGGTQLPSSKLGTRLPPCICYSHGGSRPGSDHQERAEAGERSRCVRPTAERERVPRRRWVHSRWPLPPPQLTLPRHFSTVVPSIRCEEERAKVVGVDLEAAFVDQRGWDTDWGWSLEGADHRRRRKHHHSSPSAFYVSSNATFHDWLRSTSSSNTVDRSGSSLFASSVPTRIYSISPSNDSTTSFSWWVASLPATDRVAQTTTDVKFTYVSGGTTPTPADASQSSQQTWKTSKEDASSSSYTVILADSIGWMDRTLFMPCPPLNRFRRQLKLLLMRSQLRKNQIFPILTALNQVRLK